MTSEDCITKEQALNAIKDCAKSSDQAKMRQAVFLKKFGDSEVYYTRDVTNFLGFHFDKE